MFVSVKVVDSDKEPKNDAIDMFVSETVVDSDREPKNDAIDMFVSETVVDSLTTTEQVSPPKDANGA